METPAIDPAETSVPRRPDWLGRVPWAKLIPSALGLYFGASQGAEYGFLSGNPIHMEWGSPELGTGLSAVGIVIGLVVVGLVLQASDSLGDLGIAMLIGAVGFVVGFFPGVAFGPRWQLAQSFPGTVRVELAAPVGMAFDATALCTIRDNDTNVGTIDVVSLGTAGVDRLTLNVAMFGDGTGAARTDNTFPRVKLGVNTGFGYDGSAQLTEVAPDRRSGRGTLALQAGSTGRLGGQNGPASLSGTISWDCSSEPGATPLPTQPPVVGDPSLQGWFQLHGIVTVEQGQPGQEPPFPGQASGTCSVAYPLRTGLIETVVPWVDGKRARLGLIPTRDLATLTIDLGNGSPVETATARPTVTQRNNDRYLAAVFDLAAGRLELNVDWFCAEP